MAVPEARFIGLSTMDREEYGLPDHVTIKLDDQVERRAKQMLAYPWFQKRTWQREIRTMLRYGVKLELEALSAKGISFISEEYLPKKLRDKQWLA
jgi:DNA topoisomerase-6 subunit A